VVGQRHRRHALVGHPPRHLAHAREPVEQRKLAVDVKMAEGIGAVGGLLGHGPLVASLAGCQQAIGAVGGTGDFSRLNARLFINVLADYS